MIEKTTFSTGTEYGLFLEMNCYKCKHYKFNEEELMPTEDSCKYEKAMLTARFDESKFPHDVIVDEEKTCGKKCLRFEESD